MNRIQGILSGIENTLQRKIESAKRVGRRGSREQQIALSGKIRAYGECLNQVQTLIKREEETKIRGNAEVKND